MSEFTTANSSSDRKQAHDRSHSTTSRVLWKAFLSVVVVASCYLAYGFGRLWAEWREARRPTPTRTSSSTMTPALDPMAAALPLAGHWSFGGLDWNLASSTVDASAIAKRFELFATAAIESPPREVPDISPELFEIATMLHLTPEQRGSYRIYHLHQSDLKAELIARTDDGREKAVAVACAYPQSGERWQLFELTPRDASRKSVPQATHLLPLPTDAVRRGGRFADDGRLLLELVTLNSKSNELLKAWRNAGWEVRPSGLGDPGAFSFLCARGNEMIYAWSSNSPDSVERLMLVRSPTDEELRQLQSIP